MTAVRNLGQNPYFWYSATCFALAAKVISPANRTPHESIIAMVGSSKRWATPRSQYAGSTESGPKNATLPQRAAKLEPTSRPSASAASTDDGPARHRVVTMSASPKNLSGSAAPTYVPNASRQIRSASGRSASVSGRTITPPVPLAVPLTVPRPGGVCWT
jgi:hypothetical protein